MLISHLAIVGTIAFLMVAAVGLMSVGVSSRGPSASSVASLPTVVAPDRLSSVALHSGSPTPSALPQNPAWLAYDSTYGSFYVAAPPSSVDIIDGGSGPLGINYTIPVGYGPFGVAVDGANGDVFVTNSGSDNVSVLQGVSATPVGTVAVQESPHGVAYDPKNGFVYVANTGSNTVSVLNASSLQYVANVTVGLEPLGVAIGLSGAVFVANEGSSTVSVINGSNQQLLATIAVGDEPYGVAYDNATGDIYVSNEGSGSVSVIAPPPEPFVLATIPVIGSAGVLQGIGYDSGSGTIWVGAGALYVVEIQPNTLNVSAYVGVDPTGVTYDSHNGDVCVTDTGNQTFECIAFPNSITTPTDRLTFTESGRSTAWAVTMGGVTQNASGNQVTFEGLPNTTYAYEVGADYTSIVTPSSGVVTFGRTFQVNISITFNSSFNGIDVTFAESGLPTGTSWWVGIDAQALSGTTVFPNLINWTLPAGNYSFMILPVAGYVSIPSAGTLDVTGSGPVVQNISFSALNSGMAITFSESGLPLGTTWGTYVDGTYSTTSTPDLNLSLANGTYGYAITGGSNYTASPSAGQVTVAGAPVTVGIIFSPGNGSTTTIVFTETGLPFGVPWLVNLSGQLGRSYLNLVAFDVPNGTYRYTIPPTSGSPPYDATASSGGFMVAAGQSTLGLGVTFVPAPSSYPVTFNETGLPVGTPWVVNVSGQYFGTNSSALSFYEPNGTYGFHVNLSYSGSTVYAPSLSRGTLVVLGTALTVTLTFSATLPSYPVTFTETGLPTGTTWSVAFNGTFLSSSSATITANAANGSYSYGVGNVSGYAPSSVAGSFNVSGAAVGVSITFSPSGVYTVSLVESGLPNGTGWSARLGGGAQTSSTYSITFSELNGTYTLTVTPPANYTANYTSPVIVNGSSVTENIQFTNSTYPVTFLEVGLPAGAPWTLTATNVATHASVTSRSASTFLTLQLAAGGYALSATGPMGYSVTLTSTSLSVTGPTSTTPTATFTSLPNVASVPPSTMLISVTTLVGLVIAVVACLGAALGYLRYRSGQWKAEGEKWVEEIRNESPSTNDDPSRPT
jgi:YVTN family beta-propeller protein